MLIVRQHVDCTSAKIAGSLLTAVHERRYIASVQPPPPWGRARARACVCVCILLLEGGGVGQTDSMVVGFPCHSSFHSSKYSTRTKDCLRVIEPGALVDERRTGDAGDSDALAAAMRSC